MKRSETNTWLSFKYESRRVFVLMITATILTVPPTLAAEDKVKIRTEYDRSVNTPNYIIFKARLRYIELINTDNHDNALQIVRRRMHLYSERSDEVFLTKMLEAAATLRSEDKKLTKTMLCNPSRDRSKNANYLRLDRLDDARENKWDNAYVKFVSELSDQEEAAFLDWLQESKQGYYYRTSEHESLFESSGLDVQVRVEKTCMTMG